MERSFDRVANRWIATLAMLFVVAILTSVALDATALTLNAPARLLVAVAAIGCFVLAVAYFRQQLVADDDGLHVRNLFSSFTVRWSDIAGFEPPPPHHSRNGRSRKHGLVIVTHDDQRLSVSLWGAAAMSPPGFADEVLGELERLRAGTQAR